LRGWPSCLALSKRGNAANGHSEEIKGTSCHDLLLEPICVSKINPFRNYVPSISFPGTSNRACRGIIIDYHRAKGISSCILNILTNGPSGLPLLLLSFRSFSLISNLFDIFGDILVDRKRPLKRETHPLLTMCRFGASTEPREFGS